MNDGIQELSDKATSLKPGLYRHFKGGEYEVIGVARDSEDHTRELVVYKSLKTGSLWVRPIEMFLEEVDKPEFGYQGPRFRHIDKNS
jgi:hypothetical protein